MNPYVFVIGCPRSGTTLLQRMLDSHPELAVANDTHFIPRAIAHLHGDVDFALAPELVARVRSYHRFYRLGLADHEVDDAAYGAVTYGEFVSCLYDTFAANNGKRLGGEKTPDYARHVPLLHGLFPSARFVHIIRDGRDVALSATEWADGNKGPGRWTLWPQSRVGTCALWWKWQIAEALSCARALGPDLMLEVRYEELVASPREVLQDVAAFLDLDYAESMLHFNRGKRRDGAGLSAKQAWLPPTGGLRSWRRDMHQESVAIFEELAGDLLSALGYPLETEVDSASVGETVRACRTWWADCDGTPDVRKKLRRRQAISRAA